MKSVTKEAPVYTIKPLYLGKLIRYEKSIHTYRKNYGIKMDSPFLAFLVQGGGRNILVDTGPKSLERVRKYHGHIVEAKIPSEVSMLNVLKKHGLSPEDIDFIICTHLHWDHSQNNDCFPGKTVYVQRAEVRYAIDPLKAHYATYEAPAGGMVPIWATAGNKLKIIEGDQQIVPGIEVLFTPGHTPGCQCVSVNTEDGKYLIAGDMVNLYENWCKGKDGEHIPGSIYVNLAEFEASFDKLDALNFKEILPSHDMKVLEHEIYPYKE